MKAYRLHNEGWRVRRWLGAASIAVLAGCSSPRPVTEDATQAMTTASPLVGERWELTLIGTDEWWQGARSAYFVLLPQGKMLQLSGSDGCNTLQGEATLSDERRIVVSGLAVTRKACPDQPQSSRVADLLSRAYRYLIDHDRLVLMGRDGHVLGGFKRQG